MRMPMRQSNPRLLQRYSESESSPVQTPAVPRRARSRERIPRRGPNPPAADAPPDLIRESIAEHPPASCSSRPPEIAQFLPQVATRRPLVKMNSVRTSPGTLLHLTSTLKRGCSFMFLPVICAAISLTPVYAQKNLAGEAELRQRLEKLQTVGSIMMIGAHPDDENTALLAYFARGRHVRTAYLSLTRGEGGQNLIGSEQGDALGIIRTQELLAARKIDGAEQYFTRAIDFGFTKTAAEAIQKWGHDQILSDIVWVIRRFQPDVVILCFTGTPRDGHGQHQASAILGKEGFDAAGDPQRFPEQLKYVQPWKPRRLVHAGGFFGERSATPAA